LNSSISSDDKMEAPENIKLENLCQIKHKSQSQKEEILDELVISVADPKENKVKEV